MPPPAGREDVAKDAPGAGPGEASARGRLYEAILRVPGLTVAGLAREASLSEASVRHHLRSLVHEGWALEEPDGQPRYFARSPGPLGPRELLDRRDKPVVALLRRPGPLRIALDLLLRPGHEATMGELASAAGFSPANTTYHVSQLARAGVVGVLERGRNRVVSLAEPAKVHALLVRFPPPRDLVQGFVDLWEKIA
jgi:DNA-binding transcriptional ArsR family regulator